MQATAEMPETPEKEHTAPADTTYKNPTIITKGFISCEIDMSLPSVLRLNANLYLPLYPVYRQGDDVLLRHT